MRKFTPEELFKAIDVDLNEAAPKEIHRAISDVCIALQLGELERMCLKGIYENGPFEDSAYEDGPQSTKDAKNRLEEVGLVVRACAKGKKTLNACTPTGARVHALMEYMTQECEKHNPQQVQNAQQYPSKWFEV